MTHLNVHLFLSGAEAHSQTIVDGTVVARFSCPLGADRDQRSDIAELAARAWDAGMAIRRAHRSSASIAAPPKSEDESSQELDRTFVRWTGQRHLNRNVPQAPNAYVSLISRPTEDRRAYLKMRARRITVPIDIALSIHEVIPLVHAVFQARLAHAGPDPLPVEPGTCIGLLRDEDIRDRFGADWVDWIVPADTPLTCPRCIAGNYDAL